MTERLYTAIVIIILMIFSAIAHEYDIVKTCSEHGESRSSIWFANPIKCEVIKHDN